METKSFVNSKGIGKRNERNEKAALSMLLTVALFLGVFCCGLGPEALAYSFSPGSTDGELPVDQEEIYALSPLDEDGIKVVDAIEKYPATDTWTICIYMCGSNLEDRDIDETSVTTDIMTATARGNNSAALEEYRFSLLSRMTDDVTRNGLTMPEYLYKVKKTTGSESSDEQDATSVDPVGYASCDISEMQKADPGKQFRIVLQTGGALRWENTFVNPNKTQRFEVVDGYLNELESLPLQDSCDPQTLTEFLNFCDKQYPSDHKILILWDHGMGSFGFGFDNLYESDFSLDELAAGISDAFPENPENPPFEVIVFDACLMGNLDVCHSLYGLGRYLVASEDIELGYGLDYTSWMNTLKDNQATNGAQIGRAIADSYIDYAVALTIREGGPPLAPALQFSVLDIAEAEQTYQAYSELVTAVLKDTVNDCDAAAQFFRAAKRGCRFAENWYNVYNLVDLGMFMDSMPDAYAAQTEPVRTHLSKAVLYSRSCGYLSESQGLSVYVPIDISEYNGLHYALWYIHDITQSDDIRALYYYKVAGCLSEEMEKSLKEKGYGTLQPLDLDPLKEFSSLPISVDGTSFSVSIPESYQSVAQDPLFHLGAYDPESDFVYYLGEDNNAYLTDESTLHADFDGKWFTLDGIALSAELIDETDFYIKYRSHVLHNGNDSYLSFSYNKDTDTFAINGILPFVNEGDVLDRITTSLSFGDLITPVYTVTDLSSNTEDVTTLDTVRYRNSTTLSLTTLSDGQYYGYLLLEDPRGDTYQSAVVEITLANGAVSEIKTDDSLVAK